MATNKATETKTAKATEANAAEDTETKAEKVDDRVELYVPRESGNSDPNFTIVLNGKNYILPKGKKSFVPKAVAAEYERSQKAKNKMDNAIFDMTEQTKAQAKAAGLK